MVRKFGGDDEAFSLSYDQLAELFLKAESGDTVARIRFDGLPDGEKRLAPQLVKAYKSKKPKKKHSEKALDDFASGKNDSFRVSNRVSKSENNHWLDHIIATTSVPAEREAAWAVKYGN